MTVNQNNQNYSNHRRTHPLFHFVFTLFTLAFLILSIVNLVRASQSNSGMISAILLLIASVMFMIVFLLIRSYPLKAQDRAIRAEENLRHYVLTQKLLDPRLSVKQIVALRFASDDEFPSLCQKAAEENLDPNAIKKQIKNWRSDNYRI